MLIRSRLAAPVLCAALATACDGPTPTAPSPGRAPLAAAAFTFTETRSYPVSDVLLNECTGEPLAFSGAFHTTFHVTENASTLHVHGQGNASAIKAVGQWTGASYVGTQTDHFTVNAARGSTVTETGSFQAIGRGSVPNLTIKYLFHLTVNADGTLTSSMDTFSVTCR